MNRLFKTAMLWLLALALPVQGFAAVTQLSCAPQMQHGGAALVDMHDAAHDHQHTEHAQHQMIFPSEHAMHDDMNVDTAASADHQTNTHANVKCSACATCCVGIAMLPVMPELPAFPLGSTPIASSLSPLFFGHIPDGIKRPPKSSLV